MAGAKPFIFVCGPDDFLVNRVGKERFEELAKDVTDEFSREVLSGFANNVGDVEAAVGRVRESVQTVSMFGGKRVVWLKDVNFLADTVTGRAEGTLKQVEDLQALLAAVNPEETAVIVTAAPVDRRRAFLKWCEKTADFHLVGGDAESGTDALGAIALGEAKALGVTLGDGALPLLLAKVGANTRLLIEEVNKLATYVGEGGEVTETVVDELTPNAAEGDFFEAAEAFFSGDLKWTLAALHNHFFAGGDARPILSALQNRNRILLQVRALMESGEVRVGPRGLDKPGFDRAAEAYRSKFIGATEKSSYNVFSQNPWYLSKLASSSRIPALRDLIDHQHEFITAFEEIIRRPNEQEEVLREMAVRCLTAKA